MSSDNEAEKTKERGTLYLAAMVVMARLQKCRVLGVTRDDGDWPGALRLARPLITLYDRKFGRFGHSGPCKQIERGILVTIAGAAAIDLEGHSKSRFFTDSNVIAAQKILEEVDWWRAEAHSHLDLLRHRATRLLTQPKHWRAVVTIASLLDKQQKASERELREAYSASERSKVVDGCEHFVVLNRDSVLPKHGAVFRAIETSKAPPTPTALHDGIVTTTVLQQTIRTVNDPDGFLKLCSQLRQTEPELMAALDRDTGILVGNLYHDPQDTRARMTAAAIRRCALLVADAMQRGHAAMWSHEYAD